MKIYLLEDNSIQMGRLEEAVAHELKSFGKDLSCVQSFDKPDQLLSAITSTEASRPRAHRASYDRGRDRPRSPNDAQDCPS